MIFDINDLFPGQNPTEVATIASSASDQFVIQDYNSFPPVDDVVNAICS